MTELDAATTSLRKVYRAWNKNCRLHGSFDGCGDPVSQTAAGNSCPSRVFRCPVKGQFPRFSATSPPESMTDFVHPDHGALWRLLAASATCRRLFSTCR